MEDEREANIRGARVVRYVCASGDGDHDRPHDVTIQVDERADFRFKAVCPVHGLRLSVADANFVV